MNIRTRLKANSIWIWAISTLALQLMALLLLLVAGVRWAIVPLVVSCLAMAGLILFVFLQMKRFNELCRLIVESDDIEEAALEAAARGGLYIADLQMLIKELTERLHASSRPDTLKVEAELHALQNQINPHFLYNTLEIIRSRALMQGAGDVSEMVESLALQFRYCINSPGEMVFLRQELDHIHNYLLIQRYRFGDRFRFEESIDESDERIARSRLPVLTLQPIVENALLHGIVPRVEGGTILLRVFASASRLHIVVEDDGIGIAEEELQKMRLALRENRAPERRSGKRSSGIALSNLNSRIRLYFGDQYGVDITSTVGIGTTVFVTLPLTAQDGGIA